MHAAVTVHGSDPVMSPVSPAHLAHEVRSVPGTLLYSGQRSGEEGTCSCPGSAAHEGIWDVSVSTAGSRCTAPEKPSGQSEYDALMMRLLKIYRRVMFHKMWDYVFRAIEQKRKYEKK